MASFPDLWPNRRSASAECRAARSFRHLAVLLANVRAALSVVAFLAVSELATPGAKALVRTPAFLAHLVRKPAPGIVPGASA
jgi:hypothetical protein